MKEQLNRQLGPFKLWQWLVVVIVGVGLGLLVKKRFSSDTPNARDDFSGTGLSSNPDAGSAGGGGIYYGTEGAPPQLNSPDFESVQGVIRDQDRLRDELESRLGDIQDRLEDIFTRENPVDLPNIHPERPRDNTPTPKPKKKKPSSPTKKPEPRFKTYTVQKGDTLTKIAGRFSVKGGWPTIYDLNRELIGGDPDKIFPGQQLKIPA